MSLVGLLTACAIPSTKYTDAPYVGGMYSKTVALGYEGTIRPLSEVGILTQDAILQIEKITHLPPGLYQIEFCFYYSNNQATAWCTTTLTRPVVVEAGKVQHFEYSRRDGQTWSINTHNGSQDLPEIEADFKLLVNRPDGS
jgi:hypothetical protein